MKRLQICVPGILVVCFAFATMASAAEVQGSGMVSYVVVSSESSKQADGSSIVRSHMKGIVTADDPKTAMHLSTQDCFGTNLFGADGKPGVGNGYCDGVDRDGHIWWIWFHDEVDSGTWGFIGGTGKYEGIKGGGTTTTQVMHPDGRLLIKWKGSWQETAPLSK